MKPRAPDDVIRSIARPAHQRGPGNLLWNALAHPGRDLGRQNASVVDSAHSDQGRRR